MADNLTTATIDVRANTRGMERDILKALQTVELSQINTKKSSQALGRITGQVSEFNKSLEASNARVVAFGASAGAIFAVEKALTSLISSTVNVQKQLADVNVLLNLSSSSLEKFGSSLFDIARNTAQSFSEVATAATELSRQGLGVEETLKRTNAALILTRLSGLDAKSSVEALTATLNSFSGSALDAVEVVNKLANVDAAFAVSSADLANAISRVGSTAQDAGVSLDELIALVTSAQQTTARGGAVIGNSFKTIFTRLQRGKVQDLLKNLGIDTGEGQSAISLLQQLASTYDTLGASQKSAVAEQVGGVFQINILKAALADLGKEYSVYGQALQTSLGSTDQAIRRNELLNKTVSALSSQTVASLEQAASKIGSIVFEPNAKGFLSGFNNLLEAFNNIDSESAGGKLMEGFFTGVSNFISGPGAILATAVLVKLFARLSQFAAGSAKELLGTNKAAQQQAAIEQSILTILQKNSQFTSQILSGKMTTVQAEKQMLDYLTAQSNILREQERLSKVIGANLSMKGVSIGASGIPMTAPVKKTKVAASGYVPNFATDMAVGQAMENAGAKQHGYTAGKAKKTTIHDGNGKSFKSFVNNKEDVKTFTNAAGKKATIVRPPNGFGENTQYAAGGFVPNFAKGYSLSSFAGVRINNPRAEKQFLSALGSKKNTNIEPDDKISSVGFKIEKIPVNPSLAQALQNNSKGATLTFENTAIQYLKSKGLQFNHGSSSLFGGDTSSVDGYNLKASNEIDLLEVKSGKWNPLDVGNKFGRFIPENVGDGTGARSSKISSALGGYFKEGVKENQDLIKLNNILAVPDTDTGKSFIRRDKKNNQKLAYSSFSTKSIASRVNNLSEGFIPNFASMGSKFKAMYGGGTTMRAVDKEKTAKKKNLDVKKLDLSDRYTMVHGGNQGLDSANVSLEAGNKLFDAKIATAGLDTAGTNLQRYGIKGVVGDALVGATNNIIKTFGGTEQITDASSLDNAGSVGSAAGTVFETALRKAFNAPAVSQTQRIDFPAPTPELKKFFHNAPGQYEAKISRTPDNLKSTLKKWVDVNGLASSASGYIPNFAKSGLSYSYKDKDEFGFSEIQAIMGGKKVGSFSYAEDKKGLVDVGDFSVNKGERGKGIGTGLYKEAIRRNKGKKMKGQLLPQMNRLLQKIKNGESVSAETLYPQIKRADLAKSSLFEVYGHKGMAVEKMTRDQFSSFVNAKINELKKDPKKLQSFFGNVEADEYGGLGVDLQTQHASGFIPNFARGPKGNFDKLHKGYIFPDGEIFNGLDHADAWDDIPAGRKGAIKYVAPFGGKQVTLQGKLNKSIADTFGKFGVDATNIRYGSVDDEMRASNEAAISSKLSSISNDFVDVGGGYKARFRKYGGGDPLYTHFRSPDGSFYEIQGGIPPNDIKYYGGFENLASDRFVKKISSDKVLGLTEQLKSEKALLASGFIPNFLDVTKGGLPFGVRGRMNYGSADSKRNMQLGIGAEQETLAHELFHGAYSKSTVNRAVSNPNIGKFIAEPKKYTGSGMLVGSRIFKNLKKDELIKSLGLNPIQLDFDGKNPGATYSGAKAIDEIITRIQEKVFRNKGDISSLSLDEGQFIKNLEEEGIISGKRISNISRRSKEGSKFRSLVENRFSSAMGGASSKYSGFVPNFASQPLIAEIAKRIKNPNIAQKLKEGAGLSDDSYIKAASRLGVNTASLDQFSLPIGFPLRGKAKIAGLSKALGKSFGRSFKIDALKTGEWNYLKKSFEENGLTQDDFNKVSGFARTKKGESALNWGFKSNAAGFIPNFSSALNDAIAREQSSGLSKAQIYVDSHSSLKNKNNPMGLMVANRRDEPMGGAQGIKRAKKEGLNPKTYGGGMSSGYIPNFAKQEDLDELESFASALKKLTAEIANREAEIAAAQNELKFNQNNLAINAFSQENADAIQALNVDNAKNEQAKKNNPALAGGMDKKIEENNKKIIALKEKQEAENLREIQSSKQLIEANESLADGLRKEKREVEKNISNKKKEMSFAGKTKKFLSNNALSVGFAAQAAGDIAANFAGQESGLAKGISAATSGLGTIASFASLGSIIPVYGTAIGAAVGATVALVDGYKALNTKIPELSKAAETASGEFNKFGETGQAILSLSEKYSELANSTDLNAAPQLIKVQDEYSKLLLKLSDVQRTALVSAVAQGKGQEEYTKILKDLGTVQKAKNDAFALGQFAEGKTDKKSIQGIGKDLAAQIASGSGLNKEDLSNIGIYIDVSVSSGATSNRTMITAIEDAIRQGSISTEGKQSLQEILPQIKELVYNENFAGEAKDFKETLAKLIDDIKNGRIDEAVKSLQENQERAAAAERARKDLLDRNNQILLNLSSNLEDASNRTQIAIDSFIDSLKFKAEFEQKRGEFRSSFFDQAGAGRAAKSEKLATDIASIKNQGQIEKTNILAESGKNIAEEFSSVIQGLELNNNSGLTGDVLAQAEQDFRSKKLQLQGNVQAAQTDFYKSGDIAKFQDALSSITAEFKKGGVQESNITGTEIIKLEQASKNGFSKLDQNLQKGNRDQEKQLALLAQSNAYQEALVKLTEAQNFLGGASSQDVLTGNVDVVNTIRETQSAMNIAGLSSKDNRNVSQNKKGEYFFQTGLGRPQKPNADISNQIIQNAKATNEAFGTPIMSLDNKKVAAATQTLADEYQKIMNEKMATFGYEEDVKNKTFKPSFGQKRSAEAERAIAEFNSIIPKEDRGKVRASEIYAKSRVNKELGVPETLKGNMVEKQLESYANAAFAPKKGAHDQEKQNLAELKAAYEKMSPDKAIATLQLTQSTKQTDLLSTINQSILGQSDNLATSIGASISAAIAQSQADTQKLKVEEISNKAGTLDAQSGDLEKRIDTLNSEIEKMETQLTVSPKSENILKSLSARGYNLDSMSNEVLKSGELDYMQKRGGVAGMTPAREANEYEALAEYSRSKTSKTEIPKKRDEVVKLISDKSIIDKSLKQEQDKLTAAQKVQTTLNTNVENAKSKIPAAQNIPTATGAPTAPPTTQPAVQTAIKAANITMAQRKSTVIGGITAEENRGFLKNFGYVAGEGFQNESDKKDYENAIKEFKKRKGASTAPIGGTISTTTSVGATIPNAQSPANPPSNVQQDASQLISNILTTVNQIAAELQKQDNTAAATNGQTGAGGAVSVSTPVNLSINSTAGENKTEVANVADKIKTDLTAFLSSPEFIERVTTIAKTAAGNPPPPKSIV